MSNIKDLIEILEGLSPHWASGAYMITEAERGALIDALGEYKTLIEHHRRDHDVQEVKDRDHEIAEYERANIARHFAGWEEGIDHG